MDTITLTDFQNLTGYGREKAKRILAPIQPVERRGRILKYDASAAIKAALNAGETERERGERLKSDLLEEKLRRMKAESVNRRATQLIWGEKLKRLADTIRGIDYLDISDKRRLCQQLRSDLDRLPSELESCKFDEADSGKEDDNDEKNHQ